MAKNYVDKKYLTDTYGLDLDSLPKKYSDTEIARYIYLAEVRITHISDEFTDEYYNSMSTLDQDEIKFLTCVIVEQWLTHGIPLTRVSSSSTLSAVSSSATRPQDPAYVPHIVLEGLATLGLMNNFDSSKQIRATKNGNYDGMGDNELNSRIALMIENAIGGRFDGKENKISPNGVQNGNSKDYIVTWFNGIRRLRALEDLIKGLDNSGGILWLTDKYGNLTDFKENAKDYEIVKYNINADGTNAKYGTVLLMKMPDQSIQEFRTFAEIKDNIEQEITLLQQRIIAIEDDIKLRTEANDWEKIRRVLPIAFTTVIGTGAVDYQEHFGDLDDTAQRTNFMNNAKLNYWYTFTINGTPYQAVITSGDKTTNYQWTGFRVIDGPNGKTTEIVRGSTSTTGHAETTGSFTGDAFSSSIAGPDAYRETQYLPKSTIEQMLLDDQPLDNRHWLPLEPNQIESVIAPDGSYISWRMGENILSAGHPDGHPVDENMEILFSQGTEQSTIAVKFVPYAAGNAVVDGNGVLITDGINVRQSIFDSNNNKVGSFFPKVTKITDWEIGWDGVLSAIGTDEGWKVELTDPRDNDGNVLVFPTTALPTQMTLKSLVPPGELTPVEVTLTFSDVITPLSTWLVQGKSNHISGTYNEGHVVVWDVIDAKMEMTLGAWDGSHQWTGTSRDMHTIAINRPRYLLIGIFNDQTAGYQYYARFRFELVKSDGTTAVTGDTVDYTKIKMVYEGTKGANTAGQIMTHRPRTFTGFDLKEGV